MMLLVGIDNLAVLGDSGNDRNVIDRTKHTRSPSGLIRPTPPETVDDGIIRYLIAHPLA